MSEPASPAPCSRGRIDRNLIGLNVAVLLTLVLILVLGANIISFRRFHRWDLSHNQNYELSQKTRNLLKHLDGPVKAIVFLPEADILSKDVYALLREYEFASDKKLSAEYVNPYKNLTRARELQEKYKFGVRDNIVILDYKGKSKFVNAADMAEFDQGMPMMNQPPTMKAFKGEEAITTALQSIVQERQNKLYVLAGHGEPALEGGEIAAFKEYAGRENIQLATLNLANVESVPADATGILILGPKLDISQRELEMLVNYWKEKKGRLMILLDPTGKNGRLNDFLDAQGVAPQNDRVLKVGSGFVLENGQPTFKPNVVIAYPYADFVPEGKAITQNLVGAQIQLAGATESFVVDPKRAQLETIRITNVLSSSEGYWGETEYVPGESRGAFFDPKKDHMGPLPIGVALERGGLEDARVKVDTGRMLVVGNAGFLTDQGLRVSDAGLDFALLSLNWLFNQEQTSGIPPKPKIARTLSLTEEQLSQIFNITVIFIPLAAGLIGLYVTWFRAGRNLLQLTVWVLGVGLFVAGFIWAGQLVVTSREGGTGAITVKDYLLPSALMVVPLILFALRIFKTAPAPLPENA